MKEKRRNYNVPAIPLYAGYKETRRRNEKGGANERERE